MVFFRCWWQEQPHRDGAGSHSALPGCLFPVSLYRGSIWACTGYPTSLEVWHLGLRGSPCLESHTTAMQPRSRKVAHLLSLGYSLFCSLSLFIRSISTTVISNSINRSNRLFRCQRFTGGKMAGANYRKSAGTHSSARNTNSLCNSPAHSKASRRPWRQQAGKKQIPWAGKN